jgi:hypothetical protein
MNNMSTRYAILSIVSAVGYFILASFSLIEPLPNRIAEDPTIKGKGKDGKCMDYALAISSKLAPSAPVDVELQDGLNHLSYF